MSQQANDSPSFEMSAPKAGRSVYTGSSDVYNNWKDDHIEALRVFSLMGGYTQPGPGPGYGQIFPVKQDL